MSDQKPSAAAMRAANEIRFRGAGESVPAIIDAEFAPLVEALLAYREAENKRLACENCSMGCQECAWDKCESCTPYAREARNKADTALAALDGSEPAGEAGDPK
jgi:hypothetical protein